MAPPARLVSLLATGLSELAISRELKMRRQTVARWARDPAIAAQVEEIHREARRQASRKGASLLDKAVGAVQAALEDDGVCKKCGESILQAAHHDTRLKAAREVFDRFGLPKAEVLIEGAPEDERSDEELRVEILEGAAEVCEQELGRADLGAELRRLAREPSIPFPHDNSHVQ